MFIREDKIIVIASRYLPISLEELKFHVEATGEVLNVSTVTCTGLADWTEKNPNEVLIGEVTSPALSAYLSYLSSNTTHLQHISNHTFPSFSSSNHSIASAANNVVSKLSISIELYDLHLSFALETFTVPNLSYPFVLAAMVGHDNLVEEIITFMEYYLVIGADHFLFYFLMPIESLPDAFIDRINSFRNRTVITIIQWYPFLFDGPFSVRGGRGSSELALIQDGLYRVKSDKHTPEHKAWFAHVNLDDFLVVHPQFSDMKQMVEAYPTDAAAVVFHNSYFYLMRDGVDLPRPHRAVPLGFTWEQFNNYSLVHETDLKQHNYRPKLIANAQIVLSIGGHHIDLVKSRSQLYPSYTFYLHFLKRSRGRDIGMVIKPRETKLTEFLALPRNHNPTMWLPRWTPAQLTVPPKPDFSKYKNLPKNLRNPHGR